MYMDVLLTADFKSSRSTAGLQYAITTRFQHVYCKSAQGGIVLHQQDSLIPSQGCAGRCSRGGVDSLIYFRQINVESSAYSGFTGDLDISVTLLNDSVNHRQTQASPFALFLRGEKRLEDASFGARVHSAAGVRDFQQNIVAHVYGEWIAPDKLLIHVEVRSGERQLAPLRHGVPCIDREVEDNLFDLAFVRPDPCQPSIKISSEFDVFADQALQHLPHVLDHGIQIENLWIQNLLTAESKKLARKRCGTVTGFQNLIHAVAQRMNFI